MSKADELFIEMCRKILDDGMTTEGEKVRPKWEDGTPAYTLKSFGVVHRYDLSEEFPAVTLRRTPIRSAMDEILWIWQKKSNDVRQLSSHVWDQWEDEEHTIGRAYGYQLAQKYIRKDVTEEGLEAAFPSGAFTGKGTARMYRDKNNRIVAYKTILGNENWMIDQVDKVIYDLKNNPFSRRTIATTWNPADAYLMNLEPCAYSMTFNVTAKKGSDRLVLNAILNQRSQDILAANAWNVAQYALLTMMLAQTCDMEAGEFIHVIADAHIYDRHIPIIKELIEREPKPAPNVWLDPDVKDYYAFTTDNIHIEDYEVGGPQIKDIPIAV